MRAVLTYHSIDSSGSPISVDEGSFRTHVEWLASGAVRVVPLEELIELPPEVDAVAVTFDDGLESFGAVASPLLLDAGIPVTVFIVSDRVGGRSDWNGKGTYRVPTFELLNWQALGDLSRLGVALGAHTRTHPDLTRVDDHRVEEEITGSIERIEAETGMRPRSFAYPYGAHDSRSVAVARAHFTTAVTADLGLLEVSVDPYRIPRLDMFYYRDPKRLRRWGQPDFTRYLRRRRVRRGIRRGLSWALGSP